MSGIYDAGAPGMREFDVYIDEVRLPEYFLRDVYKIILCNITCKKLILFYKLYLYYFINYIYIIL